MNTRYVFWGGAAIAIAVLAYFLFFRKPATAVNEPVTPNLPPPPPAPAPPGATTTEPAFSENEEPAKSAIQNRYNQIQVDAGSMANVRSSVGFQNAILQGVQYPATWQTYFGNLLNIPTPLDDAQFNENLAMLGRAKSFEAVKNETGFDTAKVRWAALTSLGQGLNLMPGNLADLIAQGAFGTVGRRDSDKSERYDAWSKDAQRIAANLQAITPLLRQAARTRAITDLLTSGWKIRGYNA